MLNMRNNTTILSPFCSLVIRLNEVKCFAFTTIVAKWLMLSHISYYTLQDYYKYKAGQWKFIWKKKLIKAF